MPLKHCLWLEIKFNTIFFIDFWPFTICYSFLLSDFSLVYVLVSDRWLGLYCYRQCYVALWLPLVTSSVDSTLCIWWHTLLCSLNFFIFMEHYSCEKFVLQNMHIALEFTSSVHSSILLDTFNLVW